MWRMTLILNSKLDYIGQNNTKIQIFPFNSLKHLKSVKRDCKNVSIRHKVKMSVLDTRDALFHITQKCGEWLIDSSQL